MSQRLVFRFARRRIGPEGYRLLSSDWRPVRVRPSRPSVSSSRSSRSVHSHKEREHDESHIAVFCHVGFYYLRLPTAVVRYLYTVNNSHLVNLSHSSVRNEVVGGTIRETFGDNR